MPLDINAYKKNKDFLESKKEEKPVIEQKLKPLEEKFRLLEDYTVTLNEADI